MPVDSAVLALVALKIHFFNCSVYNYNIIHIQAEQQLWWTVHHRLNCHFVSLCRQRNLIARRNDYLQCWDKTYTFGGVKITYFPRGVVYCPFNWKYLGNDIIRMHFYAGFMCVTQDPNTLAVRPESGWAIANDKQETWDR